MKRFLIIGLMVFGVFALAACGGNGNGNSSMPNIPDVTESQNTVDEVADTTNDIQGNNDAIANLFGDFYTFGDVIELWETWELIIKTVMPSV